ncbi:MAG: hypothetical protein SV375_09640, partial [Thermodesulfobacteriota bacterium]|nr:hypothetical protein [Thermodesulfobacteriota bacterium]
LSLIGIHSEVDLINHENDGMLTIDDDEFMDALEDNFNGVRRLFVAEGTTTDGDVEYINHTNNTVAGEYDINITQAATQTQETGSVVLTNGIGAGDIEVLTITQGGKTAAVTLDGDTGENGSTIDNIVNAINSELNTEYAQKIIGNVKNTTDSGQTTAITSNTVWSAIYSGGVDAGLVTGTEYEITFQGHTRNGKEVSGSYTISDADTDTVQGLLSAIESTYGYEVTASIDTDGYLVVTDNITGNSDLDLTITEPGSLNFGEVVTSNLVGGERLTKNAGADAIIATDSFSDIDNHGLTGGETIYYYGYKSNGVAVEGSYTLQGDLSDTLQNFLSDIAATYGGDVAAGLQDGRIVITNGSTNSSLGIEIIEPGTVDFGIISGGVTGRYGIDITASKDGSDHLVLTSDDYGSNANFVISESRATTNTDYNQIIYTNTANTTKASNGDIYVTSSTTWDDIYGTGTIENGDTITISGTDRNGDALDTGIPEDLIYTIDVTNNMNDLLTRIEDVFLNDTSASTTVEARIEQGKIIIEDQTSGVSQISLTLTYEDVGGSGTGNLDLGAFDQSAERDLDLGLVNITRSGLDVVGTINGEAATGSGQTLVGDAPGTDETTSVEGLTIRYTGPSTGAQGTVKITMGTAELFDRVLYDITNISDGYLDFRLDSMGERVNDLKYDIEDMEARLNLKMEVMINKFVAMELALSKIQNQSQWLTGQINASFSGWAWS